MNIHHAINDTMIPQVKKKASSGSKAGKHWWSASNHKIFYACEKLASFETGCAKKRKIIFQIAKVGRTLVSVDKLSESGHTVILNKDQPRIVCQNLEIIIGKYPVVWEKTH